MPLSSTRRAILFRFRVGQRLFPSISRPVVAILFQLTLPVSFLSSLLSLLLTKRGKLAPGELITIKCAHSSCLISLEMATDQLERDQIEWAITAALSSFPFLFIRRGAPSTKAKDSSWALDEHHLMLKVFNRCKTICQRPWLSALSDLSNL